MTRQPSGNAGSVEFGHVAGQERPVGGHRIAGQRRRAALRYPGPDIGQHLPLRFGKAHGGPPHRLGQAGARVHVPHHFRHRVQRGIVDMDHHVTPSPSTRSSPSVTSAAISISASLPASSPVISQSIHTRRSFTPPSLVPTRCPHVLLQETARAAPAPPARRRPVTRRWQDSPPLPTVTGCPQLHPYRIINFVLSAPISPELPAMRARRASGEDRDRPFTPDFGLGYAVVGRGPNSCSSRLNGRLAARKSRCEKGW